MTRLKVECLKCGGGTVIKLWGRHILRCKCGWKIMVYEEKEEASGGG